jgi:hypothetical protein
MVFFILKIIHIKGGRMSVTKASREIFGPKMKEEAGEN